LDNYRELKKEVHTTGLKCRVSVSTNGNFANAVESTKSPVSGIVEKDKGARLGIVAERLVQV
jgi:hypothetical protein